MFDTIILLSSPVEQSVFPPVLLAHNPLLTVMPVCSAADLAALNSDLLRRARLIAFVTSEIVPASVLNRLGYGAINFHPGPPSYPGWAPAHFALYNRATEFGATVHVMIEQVDAGPIMDVALFPVPADISVPALEGMAYAASRNCSGAWPEHLPPTRRCRRRFQSNGAARNIPAAPIGRSAISPSTFRRMNSSAASGCLAATISGCPRRSTCTASSFAR